MLAVGLSADTAKEGKNAHHELRIFASGIRAFGHLSDFGSFSGCISLVPYVSKWIVDDADLWDERRILSLNDADLREECRTTS